MTNSIPDIIEHLISKVKNTFKLTSITDNGDGTSIIKMCSTMWILENNTINIGGTDYKVISIDRDKEVVVQGLPVGTEFTLNNPFFIHGTPTQTNVERDKIRKNKVKITPVIYLFEPIKESFNESSNSVEREVPIRLAVLNNYKNEQFTNDIYAYSIEAMRSYSEQFIEAVRNEDKLIQTEDVTFTFESYAKYGNYISNKGTKANIFNENLSGIEIFLTIPLKKQNKCLNLCNI